MKTSAIEENQMDFLHSDQNGELIKSRTIELSFLPDHDGPHEHDAWDHFIPEPESLPRVGDEFQVEIPRLNGKPGHASHLGGPKSTRNNFLIGLPLPCTHLPNDATEIDTYTDGKSCIMVNRSENKNWSNAEKDSFLLGLYIFEKDFDLVRKFVETKEMGAMLYFYYGEFYCSNEYYRWSEGRKSKSKKCVYGQRIFCGSRQQELPSRILPTLPEDSQRALLQVSKDFSDEKMGLAQYVFCLKIMVGIGALVEFFAIGKGKRDLTRMFSASSRSNQAKKKKLSEIPSGKACSNLSISEIIKFIGGDYRLSKGRANDLFWEAVWPRLLARGWHSEQPNDHQIYLQGFSNTLVFLLPGVKQFSRRKLIKGEHYFDSVPDLLSKVAKEPKLIELDVEDGDFEKKSEEKDKKAPPSSPMQTYLQPRKPKLYADVITFTIVDTSFSGGEVRELEGIPLGLSNFRSINRTEDSLDDDSEENYESETIQPRKKLKSIEKNGDVKLQRSYNNAMKGKALQEKKKPKKLLKSCTIRKMSLSHPDDILEDVFDENDEAKTTISSRKLKSIGENGDVKLQRDVKSKVLHVKKVPKSKSSQKSEEAKFVPSSEKLRHSADSGLSSCSSSISSKGLPDEKYSNVIIDVDVPAEVDNDFLAIEWKTEKNDCVMNDSAFEGKFQEEPVVTSRRQSTRNRPLSSKALEALANGFLDVDRRRKSKGNDSRDEIPSRSLQRPRKASENYLF